MSAVSSSEVKVVIEFLRSNGFKEAESALMEDMMEKCDLGSFDYEKFLFPVLPPLRVSSTLRLPEVEDGADCSTRRLLKSSYDSTSSDDEFVSLESSTTGVCSSGFTNPYGIRTSVSRGNSDASSDSLSQFGTARDYHDLEWHNEFYNHDEKNETSFLTPCFRGTDFFGCPSEDKFILSSETNKQNEDSLVVYDKSEALESEANINYLDKPCLFNAAPRNDKNEVQVKETELNDFQSKNMCDSSDDCYLSLYSEIKKNYSYSSKRGSTNDEIEGIKGTSESNDKIPEKDFAEDRLVSYKAKEGEINGGMFEPNTSGEVEDVVNEDHSEVDTHEDEYQVFNLRIIHRKNRTGFEENKDLPIVLNTVIASQYYVTEYLGSAAFSKVFQAHDLHTGIDVCLKIIKNDKDFFDQSLDEIKLLKLVNKHDPGDQRHILRLYDYFYHQEHLFIVCELLRANLYEFQKFNLESGGEPYFTLNRLQVITRQCLEALEYLHGLGIIHCDLKPENILIKSYRRCEIKVIDLGSSCFRSDNLCLYVQSRSYRAPEVILGLPYDQKIDLWSLGCILAELCSGEVLFPNDAVAMILARTMGTLGPIDLDMLARGQETYKYFTKDFDLYFVNEETNQVEYIIPEESSLQNHLQVSDALFIDFITTLLEINPQRRPTAREALKHPWLSYAY